MLKHISPSGAWSGTGNELYTFHPSGTAHLKSDIFLLSYNSTVQNLQKMNFIIHFGSTRGATDVQKPKQTKTRKLAML